MNELKDSLLKMVLESEDVDYSHLDDLVQVLFKEEDYIVMLTKFYLSFFVTTHQIPIEELVKEIRETNLFQTQTLIEEVSKEVGLEKELSYYVQLLKEMNRNYQSNAIDVLRGILDGSEEAIGEIMTQIKELTDTDLIR